MKKILFLLLLTFACFQIRASILLEEDADQKMRLSEQITYRGNYPVATAEAFPKSESVKMYYAGLLGNYTIVPAQVNFYYIFTPDWEYFDILGMAFYNEKGQLIDIVEYDEFEFKPLSVNPKVQKMASIAKKLAKR